MKKLRWHIRKRKSAKKPPRRYRGKLTIKRFLKALDGSYGNIKVIAARLGKTHVTVRTFIRNSPEEIQELVDNERNQMKDAAEETVVDMISQRLDFGTAARTARWILERKYGDEGYRPTKDLNVGGGKTPLKVRNENVVSLKKLKSIPIAVRKQMLEEMEKGEEEDG